MEDRDWANMSAAGLLVVPTTPELQQGRCPLLQKQQHGRNQHQNGATKPISGGSSSEAAVACTFCLHVSRCA